MSPVEYDNLFKFTVTSDSVGATGVDGFILICEVFVISTESEIVYGVGRV